MLRVGSVVAFEDGEATVRDSGSNLSTGAGTASVTLATGETSETFALRRDDPLFSVYADILKDSLKSREPVAVEFFGAQPVSRILLPQVRRIADVTEIRPNEGLVVRAAGSSIPFLLPGHLRRTFEESLRSAAQAKQELLVTDDPDTHEILDVQPLDPDTRSSRSLDEQAEGERATAASEKLTSLLDVLRVRDVFNELSSQADIPFDYPDEGCTARAHKMFRLLSEQGIQCSKIWNFGREGDRAQIDQDLNFYTLNHPKGYVEWMFHVAVLVSVELPSKKRTRMVLDPCMFDRPVRVAEWVSLQHDSAAVLQVTRPEIYRHWLLEDIEYDPFLEKTLSELSVYSKRRNVRTRSLGLA